MLDSVHVFDPLFDEAPRYRSKSLFEPSTKPRRRVLDSKWGRMTILVGMVASDGILLAGDRRLTQSALNEHEFEDHEGICKIVDLEDLQVAFARVGDNVSKLVVEGLVNHLIRANPDIDSFKRLLVQNTITLLGDENARRKAAGEVQVEPDIERSLLIVFYGKQFPKPELWRLRITPPKQDAEEIREISIRGAIGNRGRFFDRYFSYERRLPMDRLIFLASHIVLTAGRETPDMIKGLDVALFCKTGYRLLGDEDKNGLVDRSEDLERAMREKIFP